jgi:MFS family permease
MLGLGIGCVIASPTALIFGKRPVYLAGVILFLVASIWAAASQSYPSLVVARIVMGLGVSPCEALPSATIAEIFFLHERAYRIGIYTFLLLGGKNLVPLVSAAIIQTLGWRWVFWIVAMVVGFNFVLLFLFVPETFWDRTPRPKSKSDRPSFIRRASSSIFSLHGALKPRRRSRSRSRASTERQREEQQNVTTHEIESETVLSVAREARTDERHARFAEEPSAMAADRAEQDDAQEIPTAREVYQMDHAKTSRESLDRYVRDEALKPIERTPTPESPEPMAEKAEDPSADAEGHKLQGKSFVARLKIYHGRQQRAVWWRAAIRPFVLFAYPAILWSTVVYALSIGWLIVLSESVAHIYQVQPYNFSRLATGLIYVSPFIGGCLGTVCAGKVSDIIVRAMCRRNGGVYEPEFRLVMAIPVALSTAIGLMGFGWSAEQHDSWIVPTVFFGIISFGCSLGSTTAITFAVDSYRQYASEALVTLNFSKSKLQ